jgi:hypothetical protein
VPNFNILYGGRITVERPTQLAGRDSVTRRNFAVCTKVREIVNASCQSVWANTRMRLLYGIRLTNRAI